MTAKTKRTRTELLLESHEQLLAELATELEELRTEVQELRESGATKAKGTREWTEEQRKAAGERLQMGRATKLGLDSIEQLRALKLRPGQVPTKAEIKAVKKAHPVVEIDDEEADGAFGYSEDELTSMRVGELRDLAEEHELELPARAKKADIVQILLDA